MTVIRHRSLIRDPDPHTDRRSDVHPFSAWSIGNGWPHHARTDGPGLRRAPTRTRRSAASPSGSSADRAEIEAAGRDVALADARLMAAEADAQPAVGVERAGRVDRPADDGGQRAADLRRARPRRAARAAAPSAPAAWNAPTAVGERSADRREACRRARSAVPAPRRSAARALRSRVPTGPSTPACSVAERVEHVEQHRMDDEAVVVVPVERRAVAVGAVALVPLVVLAQRVVDAHPIPRGAELGERRLDRRREQQPVVEARLRSRRVDSSAAIRCRLVAGSSALAQRARRAQQRPARGTPRRRAAGRPSVKFRKSGDAGSTARSIARRASSAYRARSRPSARVVGRAARATARCPRRRRPSASRCVTLARFAPAASSTGIRCFSVSFARLLRTGSASRRISPTHTPGR